MREHTEDSLAAYELLKNHYGRFTILDILKNYCHTMRCSVPEACLELYKELEKRK